jgi:hypothetical protein
MCMGLAFFYKILAQQGSNQMMDKKIIVKAEVFKEVCGQSVELFSSSRVD